MAEKTLKTRILVKYDTFANWTEKNPILKAGELAVATIASGKTQTVGSVDTPQVLIKVGDGTNHYNDLKFASGLAADVHSWAKAENPPTFTDTDTQYRLIKENKDKNLYVLQSKPKGSDTWTAVSESVSIDIDNAISALKLSETYATKTELNGVKATATAAYVKPEGNIPKTDLATDVQTSLEKADSALDNAKAYTDQKIGALPAQPEYKIKKLDTATEGYLASYQLEKDGVVSGAVIDIPKDYLVKSASCKTCTKADDPITGLKVGDKYLDFVINTKDSTVATGDHVYVNVADLVDTYTEGTNIKIENNSISLASKISWVTSVPDDGEGYALTEFEQNSLKMAKDSNGATSTTITPGNVQISFNGDSTASLQDLPNKVDKVSGKGLINEGFAKKASSLSGEPVISSSLTVEGALTVTSGNIGAGSGDVYATVANEDGEPVQHFLSQKANTADLSSIATSGKAIDLVQADGDVLIFDCGNATI